MLYYILGIYFGLWIFGFLIYLVVKPRIEKKIYKEIKSLTDKGWKPLYAQFSDSEELMFYNPSLSRAWSIKEALKVEREVDGQREKQKELGTYTYKTGSWMEE